MGKLSRDRSLITGKKNLKQLYVFRNFPVSMGCTDSDAGDDLIADMSFSICRDTGIIQLDELLPLDIVYQNQHNDGVGEIWQQHYKEFSRFLQKFGLRRILEIGGANDWVARNFLKVNPNSIWNIVEPHPLFGESKRIKIQKVWFDENFRSESEIDAVVHSHVFEHSYRPEVFFQDIARVLLSGQKHIFSMPNMVQQLANKYTNCLNFEHTVFLAEPFVDYMLKRQGFQIIEKKYFKNHSIFYATVKSSDRVSKDARVPDKYTEYNGLFNDFINYHLNLANELNSKIKNFPGNIYLFGAHIFSQHLFAFGLNQAKITNILDNSDLKAGKRLYGTDFIVKKPSILKGEKRAAIIVKAGAYRDEIVDQIRRINSDAVIFE
jgi:hypothetical protein